MFNGPGAGNDLYDAMVDLPPLAKLADKGFPRARKSLRQSTPIFGFIRPYAPDLVAWLRSFGGAMAPYDANGHYARTVPGLRRLQLHRRRRRRQPDAEAGRRARVEPVPQHRQPAPLPGCAARARRPMGRRRSSTCGELANPDCDPSQVIGGAP